MGKSGQDRYEIKDFIDQGGRIRGFNQKKKLFTDVGNEEKKEQAKKNRRCFRKLRTSEEGNGEGFLISFKDRMFDGG